MKTYKFTVEMSKRDFERLKNEKNISDKIKVVRYDEKGFGHFEVTTMFPEVSAIETLANCLNEHCKYNFNF